MYIIFDSYLLVFCYMQVRPTVPGLTLDEPKLPKRKNLSESEEPEGTESIRFTCRGLDQELIRQVDLGYAKGCEHFLLNPLVFHTLPLTVEIPVYQYEG
jgi:hypothetical protein